MRNVTLKAAIQAIKDMYDAPEQTAIRLPTGVVIRAWALVDEAGQTAPLSKMTDEQIVEAYLETVKWGVPPHA